MDKSSILKAAQISYVMMGNWTGDLAGNDESSLMMRINWIFAKIHGIYIIIIYANKSLSVTVFLVNKCVTYEKWLK